METKSVRNRNDLFLIFQVQDTHTTEETRAIDPIHCPAIEVIVNELHLCLNKMKNSTSEKEKVHSISEDSSVSLIVYD